MNYKIDDIVIEMHCEMNLFHELRQGHSLDVSDEYKKINNAYFRLFASSYEAMLYLQNTGHLTPSIILVRTMLELYMKSYYLEFIAKPNNDDVIGYIESDNKYPKFFEMAKKLEGVKNKNGIGFDGVFEQFTKGYLKSYEIYSQFSHGKGELLRGFYENQTISYTPEQITDVLLTVKGLFATLAMLFFHVQGQEKCLQEFMKKVNLT
ncbi:hypothetical protein [Aliivibrio fischeri]|uniref:hypothetical protein n=1 Tax=Aliivibrio fischeri TaxID=668 RepID=UPI0012DA02CD|nr:hypothetical protein [Aliivibrio fischeri]MUJ39650.1 hypothetical protein [Aliivibrio fischeri]